MAIVNLINRLGLSQDVIDSILTGVNAICQNFNYRNSVIIETKVAVDGVCKVNDWYKVCQDKVLKPCGNEVVSYDADGILKVLPGYLMFEGEVDMPVFDVSVTGSVINDVLGTAVAHISKNDLISYNAHMKSFYMLKALYTNRNLEWTQAYSFPVDSTGYRL